jgi:hypothetical protein
MHMGKPPMIIAVARAIKLSADAGVLSTVVPINAREQSPLNTVIKQPTAISIAPNSLTTGPSPERDGSLIF